MGPHCLSMRYTSNTLVDDKNIHFLVMRFKGQSVSAVCIRLGLS